MLRSLAVETTTALAVVGHKHIGLHVRQNLPGNPCGDGQRLSGRSTASRPSNQAGFYGVTSAARVRNACSRPRARPRRSFSAALSWARRVSRSAMRARRDSLADFYRTRYVGRLHRARFPRQRGAGREAVASGGLDGSRGPRPLAGGRIHVWPPKRCAGRRSTVAAELATASRILAHTRRAPHQPSMVSGMLMAGGMCILARHSPRPLPRLLHGRS